MDRTAQLLLAPHGLQAREALWEVVESLRASDPLGPVTVTVPSPWAGLSLRRDLGLRRGLVNVRFMALARVAELLGAPALAATGRRPLVGPLRAEAVHATLTARPGPLGEVADHPSTLHALTATFADLRRCGQSTLTALAEHGARPRAVVDLYNEFRRATASFYDDEDLAQAAAQAVRESHSTGELGHIVVWMPSSLTPGETGLVRALGKIGLATVLLGATGDPTVDHAITDSLVRHLVDPFGQPVIHAPAVTPLGTAIVSAPDPEDEVRAVTRLIVERARAGTPLHEIAVLWRIDSPYARLVPEILDAAGIAWNGPTPRRLADTVAARVLLGALDLAAGDLPRDDVTAWLSDAPIVDPADHQRVPAVRWDVASRESGIVAGATQWHERLCARRAEIERSLETHDDDLPEWRISRLRSDVAVLTRLDEFVADLAAQLAPPELPTWTAHVMWARHLVERYLGTERRRADWPEPELEASRRIHDIVESLRSLDGMGIRVGLSRFRHTLAAELEVPLGRVGRFGTGVLVGPLHQARGTRLTTIFVLGMTEGSFPPRGRDDPLLPDRDRRVTPDLSLRATRRVEERHDFLAALAAAPERILCHPRADTRAQRPRLPARWLVETAASLSGQPVTAAQLCHHGGAPWLHVVQSFAQLVSGPEEPGSTVEYDLRSLDMWSRSGRPTLEHPLVGASLGAGFRALAARDSDRLTEFDGNIGPGNGRERVGIAPVSPTALQDWARCPFGYFLTRVLRVREVPRPESVDTLSALDEGTLVHAILEEFVRRARPRADPSDPWDGEDRRLAREIVDNRCDEAEQHGITGRAVAWRLARREISRTIERVLTTDEILRAESGTVPDSLELAFGFDGAPPVRLDLPGARTIAFRGRIDRLDRSPDSDRAADDRVVVYDYKTGWTPDLSADPVDSGRYLQLPVYALAASSHACGSRASAYYWSTRTGGLDARHGVDLDGCHERFVEVVAHIVEGIDSGAFPAFPGGRSWSLATRRNTFENCTRCAYDRICPGDRFVAWARASSDPAVEPFLALAPREAGVDPDEVGC